MIIKMTKARIYNSEIINELINVTSPEELARTKKRMLLAARLDDAIKAKGWKQADFANAIGKKPSVVSKWLSGTHNFTSDILFDIERVLNINLIKLEDKQETLLRTYKVSVSLEPNPSAYADYFAMLINKSPQSIYKSNHKINTSN